MDYALLEMQAIYHKILVKSLAKCFFDMETSLNGLQHTRNETMLYTQTRPIQGCFIKAYLKPLGNLGDDLKPGKIPKTPRCFKSDQRGNKRPDTTALLQLL